MDCQWTQRSLTNCLYAESVNMEAFSFQCPGPRGVTSGTVKSRKWASWSEYGHETILINEMQCNQGWGPQIMSIRLAREPSDFVQEKQTRLGLNCLQRSTKSRSLRKKDSVWELSRDSEGSPPVPPLRSIETSMTVLKSPAMKVGIEESIEEKEKTDLFEDFDLARRENRHKRFYPYNKIHLGQNVLQCHSKTEHRVS